MNEQQERFQAYATRFNALLAETGHGPALDYPEVKPVSLTFTGQEGANFLAAAKAAGCPMREYLIMPDDLASWVRIAGRLGNGR